MPFIETIISTPTSPSPQPFNQSRLRFNQIQFWAADPRCAWDQFGWKVILSGRHFIQKVPIWFKQHHRKSHQNVIIMPLPQMNHHDFYARCAFVKGLRWKLSKRKFITEHNPCLYAHPSFLSSGLSRNSLVLVWRKFWRILKQHYLFFLR